MSRHYESIGSIIKKKLPIFQNINILFNARADIYARKSEESPDITKTLRKLTALAGRIIHTLQVRKVPQRQYYFA